MMFQELLQAVEKIGYQRVRVNVPDIYVYHKVVEEQSGYVFLADTEQRGNHNAYAIQGTVLQLSYKLKQREEDCKFLSIVVTDKIERDRQLASMEQSVWFIDKNQAKLIIYENQKDSFHDLREEIEKLLDKGLHDEPLTTENSGTMPTNEKKLGEQQVGTIRKRVPICCSSIIALNVLIFLVLDLGLDNYQYDQVIMKFGSMWTAVKYHNEYYRLVTSIFLHSGINHLFQNMLILFFVGQLLEKVVSKPKFLIIYFGSGIVAGVVSMGYNMVNNRNAISVGASGAIFGLIGAMLYVVIRNKARLQDISMRQMILFVAFSLYGGFAANNVDNAAHIGGLFTGFILAMILVRRNKQKEREDL